ncbi:DUF4232 domain-containing protein [Kitasatospora sp. CB01950]|uniref:DUF4232 domain-containing protein n=1 Tax=Kitasatospora sp. CB01950 TaxID=1703930 RepID=UPI00093FB17D|nr:DUF4232 domain-containing protein [Kitasatospora sp. CB01950]OKJ13633.1 hypothetical protein AMK19_09280 [Kitasatospora sp. CB01950]
MPISASASAVARPVLATTALTAAAVLLSGCGTVTAGSGGSASPSVSAGPCGVAPTAPPEGWVRDGVRIVAVNDACAEFEMTNSGGEAVDVSVLFGWTGVGDQFGSNPTGTLTAVAPGTTVRGRVETGRTATPGAPLAPAVRITRVRSVPTAEAPSQGGPCPASGVRLYADQGDAAMGLRVVGLHLVNCGTSPVTVDGYPQVQVLDEQHRPVDPLQVLKGGAAIATGTGADAPPQRIVLGTGEGARSTVVWRNTNDAASDPVNAPYLRVRATPDAAPVMVTPELDLGTTGRIGVGAWTIENARS